MEVSVAALSSEVRTLRDAPAKTPPIQAIDDLTVSFYNLRGDVRDLQLRMEEAPPLAPLAALPEPAFAPLVFREPEPIDPDRARRACRSPRPAVLRRRSDRLRSASRCRWR